MKKIRFCLFFLCLSIFILDSSPVHSQDYDGVGDLHNSALNEVIGNPAHWGKSEREQFQAMLAHLNKRKGASVPVSFDELDQLYNMYGDIPFPDAVSKLQGEGKISLAQATYLRRVNALAETGNDKAFLSDLAKVEGDAKKELSGQDQRPILAFIATVRYSYDFWNRYADDVKPYYNSSGKQALAPVDEFLFCRDCTRRNRWRIILADGLGGFLGALVCVLVPEPVTCIINIVGTASGFSIRTICRRCGTQCSWCPR